MATKSISTGLYDLCLYCCRFVVFIVFGNPLSMFLYNLMFPWAAAAFANDRNIFGETIYAFYEHLAIKWPFYWARHWMKLDDLSKYTVEQQIKYLVKVAFPNHTEVAALKAIPREFDGEKEFWSTAYDKLFFEHGKERIPYFDDDDGLHWDGWTIAAFMMCHVRLSWNAFEQAIAWVIDGTMAVSHLEHYLKSGKLNDSQFELLITATNEEENTTKLLEVLADYIKHYGISKELLEFVRTQCRQPLIEAVENAAVYYVQIKALKSLKKSKCDNDAWRNLCKGKSQILPEIQIAMSPEHYAIFHNCGRQLCPKAIKSFLRLWDQRLWPTVFEYERDAFKEDEIREFIRSYANLELAYRDFLEAQKKTAKK